MNHVHTAGSIAMEKRRCRHSWIPCHLQKRKCCSIVTTFQTKRKYDKSSDDVVTSTDVFSFVAIDSCSHLKTGGLQVGTELIAVLSCLCLKITGLAV